MRVRTSFSIGQIFFHKRTPAHSSELQRTRCEAEDCNHEVTHISPFLIQALNGRYWSNNGQRSARTLTGSAAIDPTATLQRTPPAAVAHAVSSSGNMVANTPEQHPGRDVVRSLK